MLASSAHNRQYLQCLLSVSICVQSNTPLLDIRQRLGTLSRVLRCLHECTYCYLHARVHALLPALSSLLHPIFSGKYKGPLVAGKGVIPAMVGRKAVKATVCTDFRNGAEGLRAFADSIYSLTW